MWDRLKLGRISYGGVVGGLGQNSDLGVLGLIGPHPPSNLHCITLFNCIVLHCIALFNCTIIELFNCIANALFNCIIIESFNCIVQLYCKCLFNYTAAFVYVRACVEKAWGN